MNTTLELIDSHCHLDQLDLTSFGGDLNVLYQHMQSKGVKHCLTVGIDRDNMQQMLALAKTYDWVDASVGVHPNDVDRPVSYDELFALARQPQVVALGETGLDYYRGEADDVRDLQKASLRMHVDVAKAVNKPLIIHTRQAQVDTIAMLTETKASEVGGVMHCFTEDWSVAEEALTLGFYISISGIVTFKNAATVQEVAARVPLSQLLIETDSPYLAPMPHRGKPNYPHYVYDVAVFIANLRGIPLEELGAATSANYRRLFLER
jgi:TatD DNase family protein